MNYRTLIEATKIIYKSRKEIFVEEGASPAWAMLIRADKYLMKQAEVALRGEEVSR